MKQLLTICSLILLFALSLAPETMAQWSVVMSTQDDRPNGPSQQTPSVAVIRENMFVAVVCRPTIKTRTSQYDDIFCTDTTNCNFLVGYINATDTTGRLTVEPYGGENAGRYMKWTSGFDEVTLYQAYKAVGMPDSLVYVSNNDPEHNILVFKLTKDSVETTDYRLMTGSEKIMGLAVDDNGYVYVADVYGTAAKTNEIKVFKGIKADNNNWSNSPHSATPVATINLPDGVYRGLAVSGDGKQLFVSSVSANNVTRYVGTPTTGYTKSTGFAFALTAGDSIIGTYYDTLGSQRWDIAHPLGMAYLKSNNLLFVACARWLGYTMKAHGTGQYASAYSYSRIYMVNPNNGSIIDTLDVAKYQYIHSDSVEANRDYMTVAWDGRHLSGYSSTYDVAFDEKKNLYNQSMYGWTVDKWVYNGTLPVITSVAVNEISSLVPESYSLEQNYPNPFNPSTMIRFAIKSADQVQLTVENTLGQTVATLVNEYLPAGTHEVAFNGRNLSSGMYFYTLKSGNFSTTKKMMLIK